MPTYKKSDSGVGGREPRVLGGADEAADLAYQQDKWVDIKRTVKNMLAVLIRATTTRSGANMT